MSDVDYYSVLKVSPGASQEEIRSAYRRLIKIWHPDINPDQETAHATTKLLNEAFATLHDKDLRAEYDRLRTETAHHSSSNWQSSPHATRAKERAEEMDSWDVNEAVKQAGSTIWAGSKPYLEEEAGVRSTLSVGFAGWLLTLCLFFPPALIGLYLIFKATFFPNGKFVGVGTVLGGMLLWVGIVACGIALIVGIGSASTNSGHTTQQQYSPEARTPTNEQETAASSDLPDTGRSVQPSSEEIAAQKVDQNPAPPPPNNPIEEPQTSVPLVGTQSPDEQTPTGGHATSNLRENTPSTSQNHLSPPPKHEIHRRKNQNSSHDKLPIDDFGDVG